MKVAALYDIHGNLPALEAVLADVGRSEVDRIVVGGDVVTGPMPRESIAALHDLALPVDFIHGNGEREILAVLAGADPTVPTAFHEAVRWVAVDVAPDLGRVLARWPPTLRLQVPGVGDVLFCHGTPRSDSEIFTELTPDEHLSPLLEPLGADVVVCGHTHMQVDRPVGGVRVVNAGSVGMSFGTPGAHWLLLGLDVELRHTPYDLGAAAARIRMTDYPQASRFADDLLDPPSAVEMMELFERSALRQT